MKTCPDCAESVQDAARKCRFCGYLFDTAASTTAAATPITAVRAAKAPAPDPASPVVAARSVAIAPAFRLLAVGGAVIAIAQAAQLLVLADPLSASRSVAVVNLGGLVLGGILLAIGWGVLIARGGGGLGGLLGGLAMVAGPLIALAFDVQAHHADLGQGIFVLLGLAIGLICHIGALDDIHFDGTRLAAIVAAIGIGGEALGVTRHWDLPGFIWVALAWCGILGSIAFGSALTVAAVQESRRA